MSEEREKAVGQVVEILRETARNIEEASIGSVNADTSSSVRDVHVAAASVPSTSRSVLGTNASNNTNRSLDEFRRRFPALCSSIVNRPRIGQPAQKKPRLQGYRPVGSHDTWTHDVCVLANQSTNSTPSRARLAALSAAGLGKLNITFPKSASHEQFETIICQKCPKVSTAGGIEVLRAVGGGGGQRLLSLVPPSRLGYTVKHLKESLGQAMLYIRPLQTDLDETPVLDEAHLCQDIAY